MIIFQIIATLFILLVLTRIHKKYKMKRVPKSEIVLWLIIWALVAVAIWWPQGTDKLAQLTGVTRGVDLIVTASVAIIFYLLFQVFTKLYTIEQQFTDLVRTLAIHHHELPDELKSPYEETQSNVDHRNV